jgi:alpha-tubulin suppressor-like RCC1 family protein
MPKASAFRFIGLSFLLAAELSACQVAPQKAGSSGVKISSLITAGGNHTCRLASGVVQCWGENKAGQLGDGTFDDRSTPVPVVVFSGSAISVAAGYQHTCALTAAGEIVCWGDNWAGQLGEGTNKNDPGGFIAVVAGGAHTCALTARAGIRCWGGNQLGALGDGTNENRTTGVDASGLTGSVQTFAAGMDFTCAVVGNRAKCWGADDSGQLGNGSYTSTNRPGDVTGLPNNIIAIATGFFHACALTTSGDVLCWGENVDGELGDGTNAGSPTPVKVGGLAGAVAIVVGGAHTCALTKAGGVKCWGDNSHGQLGDGTNAGHNAPVDVSGLAGGVSALAAGANHTCAWTSNGEMKCWGANANGELGDGTTTDRNTPVAVVEPSGG